MQAIRSLEYSRLTVGYVDVLRNSREVILMSTSSNAGDDRELNRWKQSTPWTIGYLLLYCQESFQQSEAGRRRERLERYDDARGFELS